MIELWDDSLKLACHDRVFETLLDTKIMIYLIRFTILYGLNIAYYTLLSLDIYGKDICGNKGPEWQKVGWWFLE